MSKGTIRRDLLMLGALCALVYFTGLSTHGVTNWQEAQRLVVAREMAARGGVSGWLVPTINGTPYLAKPPLIYWAQLAVARALGREPDLFVLRFVVAAAGLAGVLATYAAGRVILRPAPPRPGITPNHDDEQCWTRDAALWGALCLATGILYVRSSRIGELDILLVAPVVGAIAAIAAAWRRHREQDRAHLPAVALAVVCSVIAAMAKGPPALLVIGSAYAGILLTVFSARSPAPGECSADGPARLAAASRARRAFAAMARTHPVAVLGLPILALWMWGKAVEGRIGADAVALAMAGETEDNLRLFELASPLHNLEAMSYGVGLGSIAAVIAIIWIIKDRPRPGPAARGGWWIIGSWVGLSFLAFSLLGKGVARYLTPVWPGMALLGGMWIASFLRDLSERRSRHVRFALGAVIVALALGQAWWYALGREHYFGRRSPRDFVHELVERFNVDPARLAAYEFYTPAIDYYAGHLVQPLGDVPKRESMLGVEPWTLQDLRTHAAEADRRGEHAYTVLMYLEDPAASPLPRVLADFVQAGFEVELLPTQTPFAMQQGETTVRAVRVHPVESAPAAEPASP